MKVRPVFAWYDLWVGAYIDTKKSRVFLMILCIGIVIEWGDGC